MKYGCFFVDNSVLIWNRTLKVCLFLSRGITGGMKTVYFIVLSRLSTELSTKTSKFRFASKKLFFFFFFFFWGGGGGGGKKINFRILLITFKRQHRRYEKRLL